MAIERMYRVTIIGLQRDKKETLDCLHELGVLHLTDQTSTKRDSALTDTSLIADHLLELKWLEEQLKLFAKPRKNYFVQDLDLKEHLNDSSLLKTKIHNQVTKLTSDLESIKQELSALEKKKEVLVNIPFNIEKDMLETKRSGVILVNEKNISIKNATCMTKGDYTLIQYLRSNEQEIKDKLSHLQLKPVNLSCIKTSISDDGKFDRARHKELIVKEKNISKDLTVLASKYYDQIRQLQVQLTIFRERYEATTMLGTTAATFILSAYVPQKDYAKLESLPIKLHLSKEEIFDRAPVKLKSGFYVKHFSFITKMFGLPEYGSFDPTIYLALFIPFFFGFMFSDVGYGILVGLVALTLTLIRSKEQVVLKDASIVLAVCSVSTIVFGLLFGSFFGNLISITPFLFDPFKNAKLILISALGIGLLHLNLGLLIALIENRKYKEKNTTLTVFAIFALQIGAACWYFGNTLFGSFGLAISVILFFLKSKAMGLMEITGFVGTWFSYARLLALALATGGIALGINIIANLLGGIPFLGPLLALFIIIVGHLFNFALNILGSTVHSVRLHYIEFFSQFYKSGGKAFVPYTKEKKQETL